MHQARLEALETLKPFAAKHIQSILGPTNELRLKLESGASLNPSQGDLAGQFKPHFENPFQRTVREDHVSGTPPGRS